MGADQVGSGELVEVLAFVVGLAAGEQAVVAPFLDGVGVDGLAAGDLGEGEQPGVAESLGVAWELVVGADLADEPGVQGLAGAADKAAAGQDGGGLGVGVVVEQLVDGRYHLGWGLAELPGCQRDRQAQAVVLAAAQADVGGDLVGPGQGDVADQQPDEAFAFPLWGGRVVPQCWEVGGQLGDPLALGGGELAGPGLGGVLVGVGGVGQLAQRGVPVGSKVSATSRFWGSTAR